MCRMYAVDENGLRHWIVPEPVVIEVDIEVDKRASLLSGSVRDIERRDLERYYKLLDLHRPRFTEAEACLIMDAYNGTLIESELCRYPWIQVKDAIDVRGLDAKWGVDAEALLAKLLDLTPAEGMSLLDAFERFWGRNGEVETYAEVLAEIGLLAESPSESKE